MWCAFKLIGECAVSRANTVIYLNETLPGASYKKSRFTRRV